MSKRFLFGVVIGYALLGLRAGAAEKFTLDEFAQRMAGYGVPDVSTATYVQANYCREPQIGSPLPYDWEANGNGWLISEVRDNAGKPAQACIVINGCDAVDFEWAGGSRGDKVKSRSLALPGGEAPPYRCRWQETDWRWDVRKTIRFLNTPSPRLCAYEIMNGVGGRLALFALALNQRGAKEAAATIWAGLAARGDASSRHPFDAATEAMNLVADGQYRALYRTFWKNRDWTAYRDGLQTLLARYPDGWRMKPVMELLLGQVEERAASSMPKSAATRQMNEADARQAEQMLDIRGLRGSSDYYADAPAFWLVPSEWRGRAPQPLDAEMEIRARGLGGIPFLLALADDGTLTDADRAAVVRGDAYNYGFSSDALGSAPEGPARKKLVMDIYDRMDRPATRGEMALRLALDLVPEWILDNPSGTKPVRDLIGKIRDFQRKHAKDSDDELAVWSLPGRYPFAYMEFAQAHLLVRARQESIPALEKFLMGKEAAAKEDSELDRKLAQKARMDLLIRYAFLRGEAARPLLREFAEQLRKMGESEYADALASLSLEASLGELAARAAKGANSSDNFDRRVLVARLETLPPGESLGEMLAVAAESDAEIRRDLLRLLLWQAEKSPCEGCRPTDHRDSWEKLLKEDSPEVLESCLVLNEQLFAELEKDIYSAEGYEWENYNRGGRTATQLLKAQGARGREWLRERVRQRLAGIPEKDLPRYPDDTPPTEGFLTALRDQLGALVDRASASNAVAGLSLPEYIALPELLRREPDLNAKLAAIANRIDRVAVKGEAGEWGGKLLAWEGKLPKPALLEEMKRGVEEMAKAGTPATCQLMRRADFGGCEIRVEIGGTNAVTVAGFAGLACAPGVYGAATWRTASPSAAEHCWRVVETSSAHTRARFQEALERVFDSVPPACGEAIVAFQTQGEGT